MIQWKVFLISIIFYGSHKAEKFPENKRGDKSRHNLLTIVCSNFYEVFFVTKIVLASNNSGKIRELQQLLLPLNFTLLTQAECGIEEIPETGKTFIENALLKARHAALNSKLPAIADDSGLVVPALKGSPGIFSARFAGEHATSTQNIHKLLNTMKDIPDLNRDAYFYCCLIYLKHADDPCPIIGQGMWSGKILLQPRGDEGFGYDPIFYDPSLGCSAAELTSAVKNKISHRAKAMQALLQTIRIDYT
jgi:XTP/dITP diphosphohydrolase